MTYEYSADIVNEVATYFDEYGESEWSRLDQTLASRISFQLHAHYLETTLKAGDRVLELGAGPGRFTQVLAQLGCSVMVSDISRVQLELHRALSTQHGFNHMVEDWRLLDITDLRSIDADSFDAVVVYGGPLSYVFENAENALLECVRVIKPNGFVLSSSMSLWGTIHGALPGVLGAGTKVNRRVIATGELTKETHPQTQHQCRLFRSTELCELFEKVGLKIHVVSASSSLAQGWDMCLDKQLSSEKFRELLEMELQASAEPGCWDMGTHIIVVGRRGSDGRQETDKRSLL